MNEEQRASLEDEIDDLRSEAYDLAQQLEQITEDMENEIDYCLNRANELERQLDSP